MKHPLKIEKYDGTTQELVEDIFDMRYNSVEEFFKYAEQKLEKDSNHDLEIGHPDVSKKLGLLKTKMGEARDISSDLWNLCKKHMKEE